MSYWRDRNWSHERSDQLREWLSQAVGDGWSIGPTYPHEPQESAASLDRGGFHASMINREGREIGLFIWGPDNAAISAPREYSMKAIMDGVRTCGECGATDVKTELVAFANRACGDCLPSARKKYEYRGWER